MYLLRDTLHKTRNRLSSSFRREDGKLKVVPDSTFTPDTKEQKASCMIVGIGNVFRGDDATGLLVLRELRESLGARVPTYELDDDQTRLIELMQSTEAVVLIDAVRSSAPAGTIFRIDASTAPIPLDSLSFSSHGIDAAQAVELARTLGCLPHKVLIYGIVGSDFTPGEKLTPIVKDAMSVVEKRISEEIELLLHGESLTQGK